MPCRAFAALIAALSVLCLVSALPAQSADFPATLPGTQPLTITEPLDEVMVEGINRFARQELNASIERRAETWKRDYGSPEAYAKSVAPNRERLKTIIGAVDPRVEGPSRNAGFLKVARKLAEAQLASPRDGAETPFAVVPVHWDVLDGVTAEGLLLVPREKKARAVALPDADWTPEMFTGTVEGVPPSAQLARRLAENGCEVLVPMLINRDDTYSGHPYVRFTNQPHREFVYRMAFEMGRHIIGYEVQKVLAAVDAYEREDAEEDARLPIGVVGLGEGGLLALYSAAVDPRIDAAMVCGYFQQREGVWKEPLYRNVWSLLSEFGDAGIASLIAPRPLVIEACAVPEVQGPPAPSKGRAGAAPGKIEIPPVGSVRREYDRAKVHYDKLKAGERLSLVASREGDGPAGTDAALSAFFKGLGLGEEVAPPGAAPKSVSEAVDPEARQKRQFDELVEFTQKLYRNSARVRDQFWSKADRSSVAAWEKSAAFYRDYIWKEMIGKLPEPTMPLNPRTRKILDDPAYAGYDVVLDVYPDVIAAGILLLPTDLKPGEKRPVVVCQHGLEGTPMHTITGPGHEDYRAAYKSFSADLAKRGFIVYAPQNPYRGKDKFRTIQRKSNPLGRSLFSYIIPQHQRTLDWLSSLPNVDPDRIGFYGLSYGGKTAVRVPPIVTRYALSICSGDFNEWIRKIVSNTDRYSYMFTGEYEIGEWNMGHVANYAELANLMAPRPFMVERGHHDGVAPDEWVAWEYAKVRRHYVKLGLGDKTEIEFFDGPHAINGQASYDFLHRHLNWPQPAK